MSWLFVAIAILCEIVATSALKATDGFTCAGPSAVVVAGHAVSFSFFSLAVRIIPVGIAYFLWSGVGIMAIALIAGVIHDQTLYLAAILGLALINAGIVVLNVFARSNVHRSDHCDTLESESTVVTKPGSP